MTPTQSFTDGKERKWDLRVTAAHAADLQAIGINVNKAITDTSWVMKLVEDIGLLVAALHIVCEPGSKDVSEKDFNEGLNGDVLGAAATALAHAIVGFFPLSKIAAAVRKKISEILNAADEKGAKEIEGKDVQKLMQSASAGNSAVSSGSTPEG